MHGVALTVMLMAGTYGDCVHGDCQDCRPKCQTLGQVWYEFWCNISPHDDPRMRKDYWPLEYPGAYARGQAAHGLAPTREEARRSFGVGAPNLVDEDGSLLQPHCEECSGGGEEDSEYEMAEKPQPSKRRTAAKSVVNRKRFR